MARTSKHLRKTRPLSEVYRLSKELATEYANTTPERARSILTEKYNLTTNAYYTLLEMAITHHLVSNKMVQKIREKIVANQKSHKNSGISSINKYNRLEESRKNYSAFSKVDIRYIATYFANHPETSKESIASIFCFTSTQVLDQVLLRACKELIISDKVFEAIKKRGLESATPEKLPKSQEFFDNLTAYRAEVKRQQRKEKSFF